jgi:hypothetical protein
MSEIGNLFRALAPLGTVVAVRQEYQVFRSAGGDYVVFSPSARGSTSYHMTTVSSEKVEALAKVVGRGVTTGSLIKDGRLENAFASKDKIAKRFDVLMGLYVLVATGRIKMERSGRSLLFSRIA